ncbi:protein Shroom4 isoform X2 [Engraulis encrasicolus]
MQLHPAHFPTLWHSANNNSDLSMQWRPLSRRHSNSGGSMESLENPPSQRYFDSQLSPVDSTLLNNKRDSAYSSFSASSNTSDYALSLRPDDGSSMDNILHGLASSCPDGHHPSSSSASGLRDQAEEAGGSLKSRSKFIRAEAKNRPLSYSYEDEHRKAPPQPPARKDSFRATRARAGIPDKRCISAPVGIPNPSCYQGEDPHQQRHTGSWKRNGFESGSLGKRGDSKHGSLEPYFTISSNTEPQPRDHRHSQDEESRDHFQENHLQRLQRGTCSPRLQVSDSQTKQSVIEKSLHSQADDHSDRPLSACSNSDRLSSVCSNSDRPSSVCSRWSQSRLYPQEELEENGDLDSLSPNQWSGSRCSTPGSIPDSKWGRPCKDPEILNSPPRSTPPLPPHAWGRSVSVPGEQMNGFSGNGRTKPSHSHSPVLEQDFLPISSSVSMDAMLDERPENAVDGKVCDEEMMMPLRKSSRKLRSSKFRRRNERFATNLLNEIQRKKAELQRPGKSPNEFLDDEETVNKEESREFAPETKNIFKKEETPLPSSDVQQSAYVCSSHKRHADSEPLPSTEEQLRQFTSSVSPPPLHKPPLSPPFEKGPSATCIQHLPPKLDYGRKGEEILADGSRSRQWRWTPEHKLQSEADTGRKWTKGKGFLSSGRGLEQQTTTNPPPFSRSSSRTVESDIMPFADRRKFFEETSRNLSQSVTNLSKISVNQQHKPERQWYREPHVSSVQPAGPAPQITFRRFSYQGGLQQNEQFPKPTDGRRQVASQRSPDRIIKGNDREREKDEERELQRLREAAREKMKELEMLRQRERQMEEEQERKRVREREAELRRWDEERQREYEFNQESTQPPEQLKMHNRENAELDSESSWYGRDHETYSDAVPQPVTQDFCQTSQPLHPSPCRPTSGCVDREPICSAFYPVGGPVQRNSQCPSPAYSLRSYTQTEAYPVRQWEPTKLNRKFSLTERDSQCRHGDCRLGNGSVCRCSNGPRRSRAPAGSKPESFFSPSPLRYRAMSENNLSVDQRCSQRQMLSETPTLQEEGRDYSSLTKPKAAPPPRPPPPKWDQYFKRRASHHSFFPSSTTPAQLSPWQSQAEASPPSPLSVPEVTRQRAYSLPPAREGLANRHPHQENPTTVAPSTTNLSQRTFRPVVLTPEEEVKPIVLVDNDQNTRLSDATAPPLQADRIPPPPAPPGPPHRHGATAEWDRGGSTQEHSSSSSSRINNTTTTHSALVQENNSHKTQELTPESYCSIDEQSPQHQQQWEQEQEHMTGSVTPTLSSRQLDHSTPTRTTPSPTCTTSQTQEVKDAPLETDIDEQTEGETAGDSGEPGPPMELQCFACPITVLETDMDALLDEPPQVEEKPLPRRRSLEKRVTVEQDEESLERPSAQDGVQSHLPFQQESSANAQLLEKMKTALNISHHEDEELNYKRQLMESLTKKLNVLQEAQRDLQEDIRANAQLGEEVETLVTSVCKPNEVDKFRMVIGDLEKVISLLLSLSGRLLRVETALDVETGHHERLPLLDKKTQLLQQLREARELKEHVDRREEAVGRVLSSCLTPEQLRDYKHFVKMKAALLAEHRQLDDKIRLGEEQLRGLRDSVGQE